MSVCLHLEVQLYISACLSFWFWRSVGLETRGKPVCLHLKVYLSSSSKSALITGENGYIVDFQNNLSFLILERLKLMLTEVCDLWMPNEWMQTYHIQDVLVSAGEESLWQPLPLSRQQFPGSKVNSIPTLPTGKIWMTVGRQIINGITNRTLEVPTNRLEVTDI